MATLGGLLSILPALQEEWSKVQSVWAQWQAALPGLSRAKLTDDGEAERTKLMTDMALIQERVGKLQAQYGWFAAQHREMAIDTLLSDFAGLQAEFYATVNGVAARLELVPAILAQVKPEEPEIVVVKPEDVWPMPPLE